MKLNLWIFVPAVFLVLIGLSVFYILDINIFKQQLISFVVSLLAFFIFINLNYKYFNFSSKFVYFIFLGLLTLIALFGFEAKGAVRWIDIFGINIQISEIFKPFVILFFAHLLSKDENRSFFKFSKTLFFLLPLFLLIAKQPDLGNAVIYTISILLMMFMYRFPLKYFVFSISFILLLLPLFFNVLHDYQKNRLLSFLNYSSDPSGSSYNLIQSMISVGSGGILGKGLGEGTQSLLKFLPERHTDFIFATVSESLGFLGGGIILLLYFFMLYGILKTIKNVGNEFFRLALYGYFFLLLSHFFFNIGMNIGIVPVVGITLPFLSYGGSSLLTNYIILGIISAIGFDARSDFSMEIK